MNCPENPASSSSADFIIRNYAFDPLFTGENPPECVTYINPEFAILHTPLADIPPLSFDLYGYSTIPKLYAPLDTSSMERSGILRVFNQPSLMYRGQNTFIGIIDSGIDYTDSLFQNRDHTTRILGIWDQTIEGNGLSFENPKDDLPYGTVYSKEQINEALTSSEPLSVVPSVDESGHGTFLAAIAAGNESVSFTGAAPESFLGVVKLKPAKKYLRDFYFVSETAAAYQENDIMAGIKYLLLLARKYRLPLVILLSLGTSWGSHDGTSPLAIYLNSLSTIPGVITVAAGGNETGFGHHYFSRLSNHNASEDVEIRVGEDEPGFTLELWAKNPEIYSVGFLSPSGEQMKQIANHSSEDHRIHFVLEQTIIYLNYRIAEAESGSQVIIIRFQNPTPGIWRIRVYNQLFLNGEYHMWLPVHGFISDQTYFLRSNPDTIITEPANAAKVLTAASYQHRDNSIYIHSSRGYTRSGLIKPDLAAPGVNIHVPKRPEESGTSIAAAHLAGACADLLSWGISGQHNPMLNTSVAKAILIRGADRNPVFSYPNREWGYGTLNLYQSFLRGIS